MQKAEGTCAICLGAISPDRGEALFTAECSHTFHFLCISASVKHGNRVCPLCKSQWKQLPFGGSSSLSFGRRLPPRDSSAPFFPPREPAVFNDDEEPPVNPPQSDAPSPSSSSNHGPNGTVEMKIYPEFTSVPKASSQEDFAILIHLLAPSANSPGSAAVEPAAPARAPLDLVTVLDVSGSMAGGKIELLKRAMSFVIENLGPSDRLSVITFSSSARRLFGLRRMSVAGQEHALHAVSSLSANGGTNIADGLRKAARVIGESRYRNPVRSIILLSDGQDTCQHPSYESLVPTPTGGDAMTPIHTFGFGSDHDAAAMHCIAETSGGTFSFVEDESVIQDAFAQCLGGLLSVVVQNILVGVQCVHPGVQLTSMESGSYPSRIFDDGQRGSIQVGELYADEERSFLSLVKIPPVKTENAILLIKASCSYTETVTQTRVELNEEELIIQRPKSAGDRKLSIEVDREKHRVMATKAMTEAKAAAESGELKEAVKILEKEAKALSRSAARRSGDAMCAELEGELKAMTVMMADRRKYEKRGRAYALSNISSHAQQRAVTNIGGSGLLRSAYKTRFMDEMVDRSKHSSGNQE